MPVPFQTDPIAATIGVDPAANCVDCCASGSGPNCPGCEIAAADTCCTVKISSLSIYGKGLGDPWIPGYVDGAGRLVLAPVMALDWLLSAGCNCCSVGAPPYFAKLTWTFAFYPCGFGGGIPACSGGEFGLAALFWPGTPQGAIGISVAVDNKCGGWPDDGTGGSGSGAAGTVNPAQAWTCAPFAVTFGPFSGECSVREAEPAALCGGDCSRFVGATFNPDTGDCEWTHPVQVTCGGVALEPGPCPACIFTVTTDGSGNPVIPFTVGVGSSRITCTRTDPCTGLAVFNSFFFNLVLYWRSADGVWVSPAWPEHPWADPLMYSSAKLTCDGHLSVRLVIFPGVLDGEADGIALTEGPPGTWTGTGTLCGQTVTFSVGAF